MTQYVGKELELFLNAQRWKTYLRRLLRPWISGPVLEVGTGNGANQPYLVGARVSRSLAVEPDSSLADQIKTTDPRIAVRHGTVAVLDCGERFDTILFIDVLEHIADDRAELRRASGLLAPDGRLVVMSPAHPFLFSAFDTTIGHYRRYSRRSLMAVSPEVCRLETIFFADCVGLLASAANRLLLRQGLPTPMQIALWDRAMVPVSRRLDPLMGHRIGKSVIGVWLRTANA